MQKLLTVAKWTLIALVVLGLARTLYLAVQELHSQHLALQQSIAAAEEEIAKSEAGPERRSRFSTFKRLRPISSRFGNCGHGMEWSVCSSRSWVSFRLDCFGEGRSSSLAMRRPGCRRWGSTMPGI